MNIIWKSILVGQMVRLFWAIGTVMEFEGQEVIKPFVHKRDYSDFFRSWTDGVIILGKISDSPFSKIASETPRKM